MLILTKRSSVSLLSLVRVDVHQSLALQCSYLLDLSKGVFLLVLFEAMKDEI